MLPTEQRSEWSKHPAIIYRKGNPDGARYLIPGALDAIREELVTSIGSVLTPACPTIRRICLR